MKKLVPIIQTLAIAATLSIAVSAQQQQKPQEESKPEQTKPEQGKEEKKAPLIDRSKIPLAQRPNLSLGDVNTYIAIDKRVIVMMAALNIAGFDYEPGNRPLSALRQQVREDLKDTNPALLQRMRDHFNAHRKGRTDAVAVASYLSLALSLSEPPSLKIDVLSERLPDDVREITDFAPLLQEFYGNSKISEKMPKYIDSYLKVAGAYPAAAGLAAGTVLTYLHTEPILELPPIYVARRTEPKAKESARQVDKNSLKEKKEQPGQAAAPAKEEEIPNRVRQFVILPDLLNSTGAANLRVVRDSYYLLLGPTTEPNVDAMRRGFLTFVIDPMTEQLVKEVAKIRQPLRKLMESRGKELDREYEKRSAYYLITDSLVQAADARLDVLGQATRRQSSADEAIYQMSLGYDRGAVLVYHFYEQMKAFEAVGINLHDYYPNMLENIDFNREGKRSKEYADLVARVKELRKEEASAPPPTPPPTISNADEKVVSRIVEADRLLKARQFPAARGVLEAALKERPDNARLLYGLGDVMSKEASTMDDSDRVEEALYAAVEYYQMAAKNASPETEKWLAQRSYVAAARILDFIAGNNPNVAEKTSAEATAAYELALKLGKVEGGAYEEAEKAIQQRSQKK
ncbi:MAG: hypothetical protein J2P41_09135 [Blastocatellia bacterium]|nr:hypothetical protein [Blastocatellia bacterium]